jgi:DNA-binding Lrp family transcriptional regulator
MTQTMKLPPHYPLTNEEWLHTIQELKPTEIVVLYYLRTITPFGDRPQKLGVRELAKTLKIAPSTVSKALKRLDQLEYIDLELLQVNFKILSKGLLSHPGNDVSPEKQEVFPTGNSVSYSEQAFPTGNSVSYSEQAFPTGNTEPLEPLSCIASTPSKTIKTLNKDFKDPLYADAEKKSEEKEQEESQEGSLESVGQIFESIVQQLKPQTHSVEDRSSAPSSSPVENFKDPIRKLEARFRQGGTLPPWRQGYGSNELNAEFVEWIRKWLCSIPPVRERSKGDAIAYIRKQEANGGLEVLQARAEEWLLAAQRVRENQQHRERAIVAVPAATEPPQGNPEASANFRKMREILKRSKPTAPPSAPEPEIIDTSDLLIQISVERMRLGWEPDQFRQWCAEVFGKSCDRLTSDELLEAAERLEDMSYERTG